MLSKHSATQRAGWIAKQSGGGGGQCFRKHCIVFGGGQVKECLVWSQVHRLWEMRGAQRAQMSAKKIGESAAKWGQRCKNMSFTFVSCSHRDESRFIGERSSCCRVSRLLAAAKEKDAVLGGKLPCSEFLSSKSQISSQETGSPHSQGFPHAKADWGVFAAPSGCWWESP